MNIKKINKKLKNENYILKLKPDTSSAGVSSIQTAISKSSFNMFESYNYFKELNGSLDFCTLTDSISKTKKFKSRIEAKKFILNNRLNGFEIIKINI